MHPFVGWSKNLNNQTPEVFQSLVDTTWISLSENQFMDYLIYSLLSSLPITWIGLVNWTSIENRWIIMICMVFGWLDRTNNNWPSSEEWWTFLGCNIFCDRKWEHWIYISNLVVNSICPFIIDFPPNAWITGSYTGCELTIFFATEYWEKTLSRASAVRCIRLLGDLKISTIKLQRFFNRWLTLTWISLSENQFMDYQIYSLLSSLPIT